MILEYVGNKEGILILSLNIIKKKKKKKKKYLIKKIQ